MNAPYTKTQLIGLFQAFRKDRGLEPIDPRVLDDAIDHIDADGGIVPPDAGTRNTIVVELGIGILAGLIAEAIIWSGKQGWDAWKKRGSKATHAALDLTEAEKQKLADDLFAYVTGPGEGEVAKLLPPTGSSS